ncbi:MAG: HEAT repeat protein [Chlamydiales bacterium]|jgi:HEAT repeat protein
MIENLLCLLAFSSAPAPVCAVPVMAPVTPRGTRANLLEDDDEEEEEEKPDKRDDVKEWLATFKGHVKKRGVEDREAIALIDTMLQAYEGCGPKDRAAIVKGVGKALEAKRQDTDEGLIDNRLYRAVAVSLGEMGPESVKVLTSWIGDKRHRKDLILQRDLIASLGKTRSEKGMDTLVDLLTHHEATLQAAAADAIASFEDLEEKERKVLFKEVLDALTGAKGATDININDTIARERYDTISAAMITTLQRLSGHKERRPSEWQRWWNKNKKKNWDEGA